MSADWVTRSFTTKKILWVNATTMSDQPKNPYYDIYTQFANDAAFLWLLRASSLTQPSYFRSDLGELERRIDAQLDGLMTAPDDAWEICEEALELQQPGEVFAASVLAFRSLDINKIQRAVEGGLAGPLGFKGLTSALAWLPDRLCHSWIKKFLTSKDLNHKYLAMAACSLRREDPREYLTAILQRDDCLEHIPLHARSLRLIGELKRRDLSSVLPQAMESDHPDIIFWSTWSAVMLGDRSTVVRLHPFTQTANPYQVRAIEIAFRSLPIEDARRWIGQLAALPQQTRNVIKATAALGDPHAITWLVAQMRIPNHSRLAGEAFTLITGINLEEHKLALTELPNLDDQLPNDDPEDDNVAMNEDDRLPFPDVDKIAAVWQKYQQRFVAGQRYIMGKHPSSDHLTDIFNNGNQRQRKAAALELALLVPQQFLLNYAAKGLTDE
jgi:uncharacterized protein (TIGR02270 family)